VTTLALNPLAQLVFSAAFFVASAAALACAALTFRFVGEPAAQPA